MRVELKPLVLVAGVAGLALGQFHPAVVAKASGGSGSGSGDDKEKMSCDDAIKQAEVAVVVSIVLGAIGENVLSAFVSGYAVGAMNAACGKS